MLQSATIIIIPFSYEFPHSQARTTMKARASVLMEDNQNAMELPSGKMSSKIRRIDHKDPHIEELSISLLCVRQDSLHLGLPTEDQG